jgi:hypothetical protein
MATHTLDELNQVRALAKEGNTLDEIVTLTDIPRTTVRRMVMGTHALCRYSGATSDVTPDPVQSARNSVTLIISFSDFCYFFRRVLRFV